MAAGPGPCLLYTSPDALGVVELHHRLERKRADPALAPFFDLAEPPLPEVADEGNGGETESLEA